MILGLPHKNLYKEDLGSIIRQYRDGNQTMLVVKFDKNNAEETLYDFYVQEI